MELSPSLKHLQSLLPKPIYVVGGAVRDALLGYPRADVDLAGALTPKELVDCLKGTGYEVSTTSMRLGTVRIGLPGETLEYTTFRRDSYRGGAHRPESVTFSEDLVEDAARRDFTVNAIYWNVKDVKIEDPLNGRDDLRKKLLRSVRDPDRVLAEDGLRILRLARLAAELGFSVEAETFRAAKRNAGLLADVSPERIRDEFVRILKADARYGTENGHRRGLELLLELGAERFVVPELRDGEGVAQRPDYHAYTVLEHVLKAVEVAPEEVRLAALFHDLAKPKLMRENGSARGHAEAGAALAAKTLGRLRFPQKEIRKTEWLVENHMYDQKLDKTETELREFVQENYDRIDDLIALKTADTIAKGKGETESPAGKLLFDLKEKMEAEGVPMCVRGLKVGGEDLIALKVPEEKRADALAAVLKRAAGGKDCLTRESQLAFLKRFCDL